MAEHKSPWDTEAAKAAYPSFSGKTSTEVCIIGGGITGIMTAYMLAREGRRVVVLEKNEIGHGATGLTTAFITEVIDTNLQDLEETYGRDPAYLILRSHKEARELIASIIREENIECDYASTPNYIYAAEENEAEILEKEFEAGTRLGLPFKREKDPLGFPAFDHIELPDQAKFHPLKFVYALAEKAREHGALIYENTEVEKIEGMAVKRVETRHGEIHAEWAISAAYEPLFEPMGLFFKKAMYISYMLELEIGVHLREGIYEDMENPYHYFRIDNGGGVPRAILGGEDHRWDVPVERTKNFQALESYAQRIFGAEAYRIRRQWRGPILEPIDGLAFIGPYKDPRMLYAFGFSGNGMTYAGITARMFADMVAGRDNPYSEIYAAARVPGAKALLLKGYDYLEELTGGAIHNAVKYRKQEGSPGASEENR